MSGWKGSRDAVERVKNLTQTGSECKKNGDAFAFALFDLGGSEQDNSTYE